MLIDDRMEDDISDETSDFVTRCARWWTEHVHTNVEWNSIAREDDSFSELIRSKPLLGLPALVVDRGPSLWENIDLIKEFNGPIICCDRALKPVLNAGARPDWVVNVDPSYLCIPFYINDTVRRHAHSINSIFSVMSHPLLVHLWKGRRYFFVPYTSDEIVHEVMGIVPESFTVIHCRGNVLTTAHQMAVFMGANPVVFVGCNNGYTAPEQLEHLSTKAEKVEIEALGRKVWTDKVYFLYSVLHLDLIREFKRDGYTTINCTGDGTLYSDDVVIMDFKDCLRYGGMVE